MTPPRIGRAAAGLLGALVLGALIMIAGCTETRAVPESVGGTAVRPATCAVDRLVVDAGYDGVRVRNASASPCRFSGRHPVRMVVWRLDGAGPPAATGVLPAGATYLQPYTPGPGNGCPASVARSGAVTVYVEGVAVDVAQPGQRAYEIARCVSFTAEAPRIER